MSTGKKGGIVSYDGSTPSVRAGVSSPSMPGLVKGDLYLQTKVVPNNGILYYWDGTMWRVEISGGGGGGGDIDGPVSFPHIPFSAAADVINDSTMIWLSATDTLFFINGGSIQVGEVFAISGRNAVTKIGYTVQNVTGFYQMLSTDKGVYADVSGGSFTVILPIPNPGDLYDGQEFYIKIRLNNSLNTLTISPPPATTLDSGRITSITILDINSLTTGSYIFSWNANPPAGLATWLIIATGI